MTDQNDTAPLLPVIDYTSRDYLSLRSDLIDVVKMRIPQWASDNPNDFGLAMLEAFAYGLDTIHYYLDRVANEAYITTAVQRESLYSIAEMFNYVPRQAVAANATLEFRNPTDKEITIVAGTRCQTVAPTGSTAAIKTFETDEDLVLPAKPKDQKDPDAYSVTATEGITYKESIGVSTGYVRQQYFLQRTSVLKNSVSIVTELKSGGGGETSTQVWDEIDDLAYAYPVSRVFQVLQQTDGSSLIRFGDGIHGAIPELHSVVRATYRVGGGKNGNVAAQSIRTITQPEYPNISVTNSAPASGGDDAESIASIRINAARAFRSRDRAVTISDYVAVAESAPGISKAKVIGNNGVSVAVYVVPTTDKDISTPITTMTADLRTSTETYLLERSMAGVDVQVFDPQWVPVYFRVRVHCRSDAYKSDVRSRVELLLSQYFGFDRVNFNKVVSANDIYDALYAAEGIIRTEVLDISLVDTFPEPTEGKTRLDSIDLNLVALNAVPFYRTATSLVLQLEGGLGTEQATA